MEIDFDIDEFLSRISGNKPPFQCPVEECGVVCRSFHSIRTHMAKHRPAQPVESASDNDSEMDFDTESQSVTNYNNQRKQNGRNLEESKKFVLFDSKGRHYRYNMNTPLEICQLSKLDEQKIHNEINDKSSTTARLVTPKLKKSSSKLPKSQSSKPVLNNSNRGDNKAKADLQVPEPVYELNKDIPAPRKKLIHNEEGFIRFIDKSSEELEETVEYDLDEEDLIWLEKYNEHRVKQNLLEISQSTMELIMDRFEKSSHFRPSGGVDNLENVDEDAVCAVCLDGYCDNTNAILFCDVCNMAVHQECYGVPYIPEGQWLCRKCIYSPSEPVDCCLCPNRGGAMKKTSDDVHWAHVVCALWVPEVIFANLTFLEPIEHIDKISQARRRLQCYICKQRNVGACIQCHKSSCYTAFHVTCAQQAGLYMRIEKCDDKLGGIKKSAYCHQHAPCDPKSNSSMYANSDNEDENTDKLHLRKARKILADKRNSKPNVCVPVVPLNKYRELVAELDLEDKEEFAARIHAFWKLKRELRHGVPLLKRLQASSHRGATINFVATDEESKRMRAQMKFWQRLRHDLEKARLLAELIRKRERIKRDIYRIYFMTVELKIQPFVCFLRKIVNNLQDKDVNQIFTEPVTDELVPGYSDVIKNPMDFTTILKKIDNHEYTTLQSLEEDFHLMINNCCTFNPKSSIFYKSAVKLNDYSLCVFRAARELAECIKYDESTGLHLDDISHYIEESEEKEKECFLDSAHLESLTKKERANLTPARQLKLLVKKLENLLASSHNTKRNSNDHHSKVSQLEKQIKALKSRYKIDSMPEKSPSSKLLKQISTSSSPIPSSSSSTQKCSIQLYNEESNATSPACTQVNSPAATECKPDIETLSHASDDRPRKRGRPRKYPPSVGATISGLDAKSEAVINESQSITNAFSKMKPWWSKDQPSTKPIRKQRGRPPKSTPTPSASSQSSLDQAPLKRRFSQTSLTSKASSKIAKSSPPNKIPKLFQTSSVSDPPVSDFKSSATESFTQYRSSQCDLEDEESNQPSLHSNKRRKTSNDNNRMTTRRRLSSDLFTQHHDDDSPTSPRLRDRPRRLSTKNSSKTNGRRISDNNSSCNGNSGSADSDSCESDDDEQSVKLEPLDVVWARCSSGDWFPAMIIDPDMPKDGYFHNGVPIAAPPSKCLKMCGRDDAENFLVHLFDEEGDSWEWLPRHNLEALAVDIDIDREKARSIRKSKSSSSKLSACKTAYDKAIAHLRKVTGRPFVEFSSVFE